VIPVFLPMMLRHRDSGPSWCEKRNCQCPCHRSTKWYYSEWFMCTVLLFAVFVFCWLVVTLYQWVMPYPPYPPPTLWEVLKDQWAWAVGLTHRIY
jgi:hypothetical protein